MFVFVSRRTSQAGEVCAGLTVVMPCRFLGMSTTYAKSIAETQVKGKVKGTSRACEASPRIVGSACKVGSARQVPGAALQLMSALQSVNSEGIL